MERTPYHEIINTGLDIAQTVINGIRRVLNPEDTPNTGAAPMLDRELYGQGTLFDLDGIHRDSTARGDEW